MIDLTNVLQNVIYANKDFLIFLMMKNPPGGQTPGNPNCTVKKSHFSPNCTVSSFSFHYSCLNLFSRHN